MSLSTSTRKRKQGGSRAVLKAQEELKAAVESGSDTTRFNLDRLPLPKIAHLEVLPVFDHIEDSDFDVYKANEDIFFGKSKFPSKKFEEAVKSKDYARAAAILKASVPPRPEEEPETKSGRGAFNNANILDRASRVGLTVKEVSQLLKRHSYDPIKQKDLNLVLQDVN